MLAQKFTFTPLSVQSFGQFSLVRTIFEYETMPLTCGGSQIQGSKPL